MVHIFLNCFLDGLSPIFVISRISYFDFHFLCIIFDSTIMVQVDGFSWFIFFCNRFVLNFYGCVFNMYETFGSKKGFPVSQNYLLSKAPLIVDCSKQGILAFLFKLFQMILDFQKLRKFLQDGHFFYICFNLDLIIMNLINCYDVKSA